ncbi:hypothetical protein FA10DRAFT_294744 [Acaromyces ingoldii]|uniref:Uncharacterized protein n=1 Tax=Acaromyces ingoldii TaxID=215250 RepID=A0A316YII3_9BASI|nr:hypothetical protein FA10DRAFT_294744 [Acaromyces ingoldii]PWN88886.1 hypothetical protein FA10DRAFT_294744 [Acaromyces ingoldii]
MKAHGRLLVITVILIAVFVDKSLSKPLPGNGKCPHGEGGSGDVGFGDGAYRYEDFGHDGLGHDAHGLYVALDDGSDSSDNTDEHIGDPWVGELEFTSHLLAEDAHPHDCTGSSSGSNKGKGIVPYLTDKIKSLPFFKPRPFTEKEEKQRKKFNKTMVGLIHYFEVLYRWECSKPNEYAGDRYRILWESLATQVFKATPRVRREMRKLAKDEEEWKQWKSGHEPEELEEKGHFKVEPREVSIPEPCEETGSSSQIHH